MSKNLVLVASHPKAGNTWVRLLFENLRRNTPEPVSINALSGGFYGVSRRLLFDSIAPVNASDLVADEIDDFQPEIFRQLSTGTPDKLVIKIHDRARRTPDGGWLFPPDCVHSIVHVIRHPFDIAVSYANHLGVPIERAVDLMAGQEDMVASAERRLPLQLHERIGSWSGHVLSWEGETPYPVTLVRYEDLHADAFGEFRRLALAAGLASSDDAVARAIEATRFERLRDEEARQGFRERPRTSGAFFRAGRPRSWDGALDETLRQRLVADHGATMQRYGYDADGSTHALPR